MEGKRLGTHWERSVRAYDGAAPKQVSSWVTPHASHDGGLNQRRTRVMIRRRPTLGRGNAIERSDEDYELTH